MTVERPVTEVVERKAPRGESCCGRNCARRDDRRTFVPGALSVSIVKGGCPGTTRSAIPKGAGCVLAITVGPRP
jgi:hypothetical protein